MADRLVLRVLAAVLVAVTVAACGGANGTRGTTTGQRDSGTSSPAGTIHVYSSLPLSGPEAAEGLAIERGLRVGLATLEQPAGEVDGYKVVYIPKNDAGRGGWSPKLTARNAQQAASDPRAGLYVGELNSGATEVALPILNQAGIVDITPGSAYVGLTNSVPGGVTAPTEPDRFYPDPKLRNLLRLIPNEMVQASAILDALSTTAGPCQRVTAIGFGGSSEAASAVLATQVTARYYGMTYVPGPAKPLAQGATEAELLAYVHALAASTVGCLVLTGRVTATATALVRLVRAVLPHDSVVGSSGYCSGSLNVPGWYCTSPVLPLARYTGGDAYTQYYHRSFSTKLSPNPYGVYGFMAAELVVAAIEEVQAGDLRTQLQRALLGSDVVQSSQIIGAVKFDTSGNLENYRRVGLYRATPGGHLQFVGVISPMPGRIVGGSR